MEDRDLVTVQAEVIALQAVLLSVFRKLVTQWPATRPVFCSAFDDAETILSGVVEKLGSDASSDVTLGSLRVVEELRRAILHDNAFCPDDGRTSRPKTGQDGGDPRPSR